MKLNKQYNIMKSTNLKILLVTILSFLSITVATAHDFEVNGIFYNILSDDDKTVEVTFQENKYHYYDSKYTGSVIIPQSVVYNNMTYKVTSIGFDAFCDCPELTSIAIPNSVTNIGEAAFRGCTGLTNVTIPNSTTNIGDYVLEDCSGLTSIEIPNSVTSIGISMFKGCSALTSITIPNSVTSIGDEAFENCSALISITIPNSVTSIGFAAFKNCI